MPTLRKSRTYKTVVNTLLLEGQRVNVHSNGITWTNPDDGKLRLLGKSRIEAIESLKKWKANRLAYVLESPGRRESMREAAELKRGRGGGSGRAPEVRDADGQPMSYLYVKALYYARARACRTGRAVMTAKEFSKLVERAAGCCEVTGIKFSGRQHAKERKALWSPSIDRLDCDRGYEFDNCRLVCVAVNIALNEFGVEPLLTIAAALTGKKPKDAT